MTPELKQQAHDLLDSLNEDDALVLIVSRADPQVEQSEFLYSIPSEPPDEAAQLAATIEILEDVIEDATDALENDDGLEVTVREVSPKLTALSIEVVEDDDFKRKVH